MDIRPRWTGLKDVARRLERVTRAIERRETAWRRSIRNLERHVERTFATRGAHASRRTWRRHRRGTKKARRRGWGYYRRAGGGVQVNVWSGQVLRDFARHGPKHIEWISRSGFEWGADYQSGLGANRKWYRRTPLRFGRRGQRTAVVLGPYFDQVKGAIRGAR